MIPTHHPLQTFEAHQADMAQWMGVSVAVLNATHDDLHRATCRWLGVESFAMLDAAGEFLSGRERELAALEETAVLHLQRLLHAHGVGVPPC